jgi:hypothetical protein
LIGPFKSQRRKKEQNILKTEKKKERGTLNKQKRKK